MKVIDKKKLLTGDLVQEIENIVLRGNTAEVKRLKHEVVVFERISERKISAPVESRE